MDLKLEEIEIILDCSQINMIFKVLSQISQYQKDFEVIDKESKDEIIKETGLALKKRMSRNMSKSKIS